MTQRIPPGMPVKGVLALILIFDQTGIYIVISWLKIEFSRCLQLDIYAILRQTTERGGRKGFAIVTSHR